MKKIMAVLFLTAALTSCSKDEMKNWKRYGLPEGFAKSHILSIDSGESSILIGTYGKGALFSDNNGESWAVLDTGSGLSWNFVLGGARDGDYIVLATLGDGLNISTDYGKNWERYGYNYFGIEYLYTVDAKIKNGKKYVPTADGLVMFEDIKEWSALDESAGIGSQYIYDMKIRDNSIALGTLHGFSLSRDGGESWVTMSPNEKYTDEHIPACKVRAVEFSGKKLFAGCDDGLFYSKDSGKTWEQFGADNLTSRYVRDLAIDDDRNLWIATYKEIAAYNLKRKNWKVYNTENGLPPGGVNCIGVTNEGGVLAGTNDGLFRLEPGPAEIIEKPDADNEFTETEEPIHQWMLRPVRPDDQNLKDQTYLYGSTMGGNFRQHQGNEYNAPEGTPLLAVDDGIIVYIDREIGHSVLKCDHKEGDFFVYAHYHHQHDIFKNVGDVVKRGDIIGSIGKKGNVTNEHLHFEVSLSKLDDSNRESHTRNSELWIEPLPGTGTIIGKVVDEDGEYVPGVRVYGVTKPIPTESPFSFAETYQDKVHPDEAYNENFVISDVPEGSYILSVESDGKKSVIKTVVEAGKITNVVMTIK
ncbi:MAG: peptidoglycan DD-metalloendopeptidase family protein [Candidatus Zixiibacteriota bacterium]|nr:MAG: peptidoglycan DD-metalloendopeptidase family protein [candidate division Zixibacteria bacterium]